MASIGSLRLHTDLLIDELEGAGVVVGDATDPTDPHGWQGVEGQSTFIGFAIVYDYPGSNFDGPFGCPDDDATLMWQITCVGATRPQAAAVADNVNEALLGARLVVPGRRVGPIRGDIGNGGVTRDDTVQPNLFLAMPRFRLFSSPLVS